MGDDFADEGLSRELLRRAHVVAGIGTYKIDLAAGMIHLSAEMAHLLRAGDHATSMSLADYRERFYHPDDKRGAVAKADVAYARREKVDLETRVVRGDGQTIWVRASSSTVAGPNGEPLVVGVVQDVTESTVALLRVGEQARLLEKLSHSLAASEALLRMFIAHTPVAVAMFDRDMHYLQVSDRWLHDYRLQGRDVLGRSHYELVPDVPERWKEVLQRCLAGAHERCAEDSFSRADGSVEWLEWDVQPWRDAEGTIGGVIVFTQVITERKRDQERHLRAEHLFRALTENSLVGIFVRTNDRITYVNPAIERMFGYAPGELIGKDPVVVIHPDDRAYAAEIMKRRMQADADEKQFEVRGVRKDGTTLRIDVFGFAAEIGGVPSVVGNIVDITERRELEDRFRALAENSLAGVYIAENGRFLYTNAALDAMYECEPGALIGRPVLDVIHPDERAEVGELLRRRAAGEIEVPRYETRAVTARGNEIWVEVIGSTTVQGGRPAIFGHVLDITARKHAEAELARSEQRWRTFIEDAPVAIGVQRHGITLYVNKLLREMWGYESLESAIGREIGEMWAPPFDAQVMELARNRHSQSGPRSYENVARRRDGTTFPVCVDVVTIDLPDGPAGIAFMTDISEQRRARDEIADREARFRELAETIDQVFWIREPDGRLRYVSPAFEHIWRRPIRDLDSWPPAVHPDDRERVAALTGAYTATYRIVRPGGEVRWVRDHAYALRDERGEIYRVLGAASDITEQESLEHQLRHAQKMEAIGVLAGGVAHDFNNVLAVILSYASMLMEDLAEPDPRRSDAAEIYNAAQRAARMTSQLLAFSRQHAAEPRVVDLNEVITSCEKMLRRLIGEHITLATTAGSSSAPVFVDPGHIEQVLMNLVVNARDAMPTGGRLAITTAVRELDEAVPARGIASGRWVVLSVEDTGTGIDSATQSRIFEPFFTTKGIGKGTGLGLSTVFGIVKQSGGHIEVDSELGRGTTFLIWLPFAIGPRASSNRMTLTPPVHGRETILLVEDDDAVRRVAQTVLAKHGYQVLECRSGGDAMVVAESHGSCIDLLLTDMVMPLMSGEQLYDRLRAVRPTIKVAFMSGYPEKTSEGAPVAGAFIRKPFTPEILLARVRELLA